jgi:predicted Zn-dependent protease
LSARITKRQMKEDTFISTMLRAWEYVREHERAVFIGLIALCAVVAISGWAAYSRRQSRIRAAARFSEAVMTYRSGDFNTAAELFGTITKETGGTQEGAYAQYFVGKCALETGRYLDAAQAFDRYLARSGRYPFFHDAAMEGKAVALSNERRYEEAADTYLELVESMKTNTFMETTYLRRAADNLRLANKTDRAIEVLGTLLGKTTGTDRRDIELELDILRG